MPGGRFFDWQFWAVGDIIPATYFCNEGITDPLKCSYLPVFSLSFSSEPHKDFIPLGGDPHVDPACAIGGNGSINIKHGNRNAALLAVNSEVQTVPGEHIFK
jgi:hypothetical protein